MVLGELGTDQVKYRGYSFPDLDAVGLPGVPFLDQLVEVLFSVDFKHYDRVFKKTKQTVSINKRKENYMVKKGETALTS